MGRAFGIAEATDAVYENRMVNTVSVVRRNQGVIAIDPAVNNAG